MYVCSAHILCTLLVNVWYGESFVMERKLKIFMNYGIELISCSSGLCV